MINDSVKLLAVDDVPMNLELLELMLSGLGGVVLKALHGGEALRLLEEHPDTDTILLDLEMPVLNGFDTLETLKKHPRLRDIPVIVVTSDKHEVLRALALGANDFLGKPYNPEELLLRVRNHVRSKKLLDLSNNMSLLLEQEVIQKTADLSRALEFSRNAEYEISLRLGRAAEFRDVETGMHIRRISEFSYQLGKLAGLSEKACQVLRFSSPLHDVGKIGIPDRILLKPGSLDDEEMRVMRLHTQIGASILSEAGRFPLLAAGQIIALQHHEKWDGSGYPNGLAGKQIHIFGRIVMVVDVFDALLSERPYKKAFSLEETLRIMENGRGIFFDPELLTLLLENLELFCRIRGELKDDDAGPPLLQLVQAG
ncbi:two-component system response regulator [Geomonas limicola]|uniref:Two-component system response regulator n=1 Tax=Geomonas limicola TaxID=2740186 RepID=A0A6V8NBC0_9BACT|nr:HD domain-containing phosphohydrolase [Geomonas limicola]GFO69740.1 two-component system response regulator [Geomonas limicola]